MLEYDKYIHKRYKKTKIYVNKAIPIPNPVFSFWVNRNNVTSKNYRRTSLPRLLPRFLDKKTRRSATSPTFFVVEGQCRQLSRRSAGGASERPVYGRSDTS
jgi:hypothetical protein